MPKDYYCYINIDKRSRLISGLPPTLPTHVLTMCACCQIWKTYCVHTPTLSLEHHQHSYFSGSVNQPTNEIQELCPRLLGRAPDSEYSSFKCTTRAVLNTCPAATQYVPSEPRLETSLHRERTGVGQGSKIHVIKISFHSLVLGKFMEIYRDYEHYIMSLSYPRTHGDHTQVSWARFLSAALYLASKSTPSTCLGLSY